MARASSYPASPDTVSEAVTLRVLSGFFREIGMIPGTREADLVTTLIEGSSGAGPARMSYHEALGVALARKLRSISIARVKATDPNGRPYHLVDASIGLAIIGGYRPADGLYPAGTGPGGFDWSDLLPTLGGLVGGYFGGIAGGAVGAGLGVVADLAEDYITGDQGSGWGPAAGGAVGAGAGAGLGAVTGGTPSLPPTPPVPPLPPVAGPMPAGAPAGAQPPAVATPPTNPATGSSWGAWGDGELNMQDVAQAVDTAGKVLDFFL